MKNVKFIVLRCLEYIITFKLLNMILFFEKGKIHIDA